MSSSIKVLILLATRNGGRFLSEQLASYRAQTHANWELLVSDDGSTDGTVPLLQDFASSVQQRVVICQGPQLGFWQNFVSLVRGGDRDAELFAFSDQDDIWHPQKLERAVAWFATVAGDTPALYFTRTELIKEDGSPTGFSPLFRQPPGFQNALVQNIGGGNTMVFNRAARALLIATPDDASIVSHDWWAYQVISGCGGATHYDPWPSVQYRQHQANLVGSNVGWRARLLRLSAFANGRVVGWNNVNLAVLAQLRHLLTPANAKALDSFAAARAAALPRRLWLVWKSGAYRQSAIENVGLFLGALFGRL
ncbi:MAG TPA: glycosyltransferase family 2 protein [Rhodopseudomonas sp.]